MYQLYLQEQAKETSSPVSPSFYSHIFVTKYNYSFHRPKKDQCLLCTQYLNEERAGEVRPEVKETFKEHQQRKKEARAEKEKDKNIAKKDRSVNVATFDMEAVLPTPCTDVGVSYYKRKLAVYNLSVFSLADRQGICYLWNETQGKKGSCEIGTCFQLYLKSLPNTTKHVILYSDTCAGQNRNQFVAAALHHAVMTIDNIEVIDQKFLESGHTQMECDAMHSAIERAKKTATIYIPGQWNTVIQSARAAAPYVVVPLNHEDVWDFKKLATSRLRNTKTDFKGDKVNWLAIKWLRYLKDDEGTWHFKYRMHEDLKQLKIKGSSRRGQRLPPPFTDELPRRYDHKIPIPILKENIYILS